MQAIGDLYQGLVHPLTVLMQTLLVVLYGQLALIGIPSWGLTIIVFTVLVKLVFWPLTVQQIRASKAMQALQPELNDLKKTHGKDREKLMQEQMRLYKENRVNPMAGCLPMLIQLPIWIGLYQALYVLAKEPDFAGRFLWIPSLAHPEPIPYILAILTAASQFIVQRMMAVNATDPQQKQMNQMMQFMPLMYLVFSVQMPAGLVLYWVASNVFTLIQQSFYYGWSSVIFWKSAPATVAPARSVRREVVAPPPNGTSNGVPPPSPTTPRRAKKRKR